MAYITLNKNHFFNNLDIIAKLTKGKDKIALVLKDNAYGHGLLNVAKMAQEYGVTKAVVRTVEEALRIEVFFEYILVLGEIPKAPSQKIRYTINDMKSIALFPQNTLVELKVNTGMNRNGIEMDELQAALALIEKHKLILEAIFTHHGCADELHDNYALQVKNFESIKAKSPHNLRFHSCNSAALFRAKNFDEDMVRVGIAAYGCLEMPMKTEAEKLEPVLSLYAKKISSRIVKKGEYVGYGATFKMQKSSLVGNYDFGYGDGFMRRCSHVHITPNGTQIVGRISMDNSSFLSDTDELLVFNDARVVADEANTISYEVLTSLKKYIHREIITFR